MKFTEKIYITSIGKVSINAGKKSDIPNVLAFIKKVNYNNSSIRDIDEDNCTIDEEKQIIDIFSKDNNLFLIARLDETIIGTATLTSFSFKRWQHKGHFGILISSDYRRKGIGDLLLENCKSFAVANEITNISLIVHKENNNAINMYEKNGFTINNFLSDTIHKTNNLNMSLVL